MEKRIAYVIFNKKDRTFATRKSFVKEFSECRIYKEKHHAANCVEIKHSRLKQDLAIIPIEVTIDPYDEFSAIMGVHDVV